MILNIGVLTAISGVCQFGCALVYLVDLFCLFDCICGVCGGFVVLSLAWVTFECLRTACFVGDGAVTWVCLFWVFYCD